MNCVPLIVEEEKTEVIDAQSLHAEDALPMTGHSQREPDLKQLLNREGPSDDRFPLMD